MDKWSFWFQSPRRMEIKSFITSQITWKCLGFATFHFRGMCEAHSAFWVSSSTMREEFAGLDTAENHHALIWNIKQQLNHSNVLFWILTWSTSYSKRFLHLFPFSIQHFMDGNTLGFGTSPHSSPPCSLMFPADAPTILSSFGAEPKHFGFLVLF